MIDTIFIEKMGLFWLCLVGLVVLVPGILGWGKEGHYAVCKIAEVSETLHHSDKEFLSEDALAAVKELLPESAGGDLASVCSWPDEIRFHYRWSSALHYVDTPDFLCNYNYNRDCHDSAGHKGRCVTAAIHNYTMQLLTYQDSISKSEYNLTEALLFLSHFIGDVHQPLDAGGNTIIVCWYRRKTNLHHVWDNMIIESAVKTIYSKDLELMIEAIQRNITDAWFNDMSSWQFCANNQSTVCPDEYSSESIRLACKFAYRNATPGSTLNDDYFLSRLPIVEKRLAESGVRLASTLNRIFSSKPKIAEA